MDNPKDGPNTKIVCNLCNETIDQCCMLSPDFSLKLQFDDAMKNMRKHFKDIHEIEKPSD